MDGAPEDEQQSASAAPEAAAPEASAEASAVPEAGDGAPTKAAALTPLPTGWTSHVDGQTGATVLFAVVGLAFLAKGIGG